MATMKVRRSIIKISADINRTYDLRTTLRRVSLEGKPKAWLWQKKRNLQMTENERSKSFYEVLGLSRDASDSEIRVSYKKLLLQSHPDKLAQKNGTHSTEMFLELDEAWKVLSDPAKRKEYDAQITAEENDQSAPVQLEIQQSDMIFSEETSSYSMDCRCGGQYVITEEQLQEGYDSIPCNTCTLLSQLVE